jgi:D-alanyl-lipoteichoic acid acyltransferase DltB (MBOAT superfamily)
MNVCSIPYIAFCAVLAVAFHVLPGKTGRRLFLTAANIGFVVPWVPNVASGLVLALFIAATYGAIRLARARPPRWVGFLVLAVAVGAFVVLKRYAFLEWVMPDDLLNHGIVVVGLSYMLFKFVHVFVDMQQGQIERFGFLSYANYQLAFFTLLAGPIQRYPEFHAYWEDMDVSPREERNTWLCWSRTLTGMVKMGALAPLVWDAFDRSAWHLNEQPAVRTVWWFLVCLYSYPIYLYLNFSGYTDVAIGSAGLLGFRLPENFNRPYLARNINDFWNRWHMTLTHWIRDYLFMTGYKAVAQRRPRWSKVAGYFFLFLALFLAGCWHGSTSGFAVFGMLQGLGAALGQAYGDALKSYLGRPGYHRYQRSRLIECTAIVLTFHYVCFTMLFFSSGVGGALGILGALAGRMEIAGWAEVLVPGKAMVIAVVVCPTVILGALWQKDSLIALMGRLASRWTPATRTLRLIVAGQAVLAVFLLVFFWAFNQKDPVVVYVRF